jgi:hypothetical protein
MSLETGEDWLEGKICVYDRVVTDHRGQMSLETKYGII